MSIPVVFITLLLVLMGIIGITNAAIRDKVTLPDIQDSYSS